VEHIHAEMMSCRHPWRRGQTALVAQQTEGTPVGTGANTDRTLHGGGLGFGALNSSAHGQTVARTSENGRPNESGSEVPVRTQTIRASAPWGPAIRAHRGRPSYPAYPHHECRFAYLSSLVVCLHAFPHANRHGCRARTQDDIFAALRRVHP